MKAYYLSQVIQTRHTAGSSVVTVHRTLFYVFLFGLEFSLQESLPFSV
jgi:hypothetical protein